MPPTLHTPRLTMTPPTADDLGDMTAMWTDAAVYAGLLGRPATREEVWYRLQRYVGNWTMAGYGHWLMRRRDDGVFVGAVGIMDPRRETVPSFEGVPEVGWSVMGHAQGGGYAGEALAAMFGWADARLPRTVCIIAPDNAPSIKLAERIGYRRYAEGTYGEKPTLFFERIAGR